MPCIELGLFDALDRLPVERQRAGLDDRIGLLLADALFADDHGAMQAFRPRWHIEDDGDRELKEGFGLKAQRWGRDAATAHCRTTLTILAFNTAPRSTEGGAASGWRSRESGGCGVSRGARWAARRW